MSRPSKASVRDTLIGAAVVLFVVSPSLFTHKGFGLDSTNHSWLILIQGVAIKNTWHPTLFLSAQAQGVLEPYFGFYGGTLYAFAGGISALLGQQPQAAYTLSCILFVAMAYRGTWLLARHIGVRPLVAHLPAFIFLTSAYYLTDLYSRAAWPEFVALSCLPFSLAYGWRLLREPWDARTVFAFAFGTIFLTGSHNISLLFSSIIVGIVGLAAYVLGGSGRPALRSVLQVFLLTVLCVLVNAWFLGLDVLHASDTVIANQGFAGGSTVDFDWLSNVLSFFRTTPKISTTFGLTIAAPVLALCGAIWLRTMSPAPQDKQAAAARRVLWVLAVAVVVLVGMIRMPINWWVSLGSTIQLIQFPYRLSGWIALGAALIVAFSIRLLGTPSQATRRKLVAAAAVFVVITVVQSAIQLFPSTDNWIVNRDRVSAFEHGPSGEPISWYDDGSYRDVSLPLVTVDPARNVMLQLPKPGDTSIHATGEIPEGDGPIVTNIAGGPYVVSVTGKGIKVVGRSDKGFIVIARTPGSTGPVDITVRGDGGANQTGATVITLAALLTLALFIAGLAIRGRRRRRTAGPEDEAASADATDPRDDAPAAGSSLSSAQVGAV